MSLRLFFIAGLLCLSLIAQSQIMEAEYFFDTDPGFGNGTPISVTANDTLELDLALDISNLSYGSHRIYVRAKNAAGWGWMHQRTFNKPKPQTTTQSTIIEAEYFFDTDPGFGNGTPISLTTNDTLDLDLALDISSLSYGSHRVYVRAKNELGWGWMHQRSFNKPRPQVALQPAINVTKAEYFFDTDPGFGNGFPLVFDPTDSVDLDLIIDLEPLTYGPHRLFVRAQNAQGNWGLTQSQTFIRQYTLTITADDQTKLYLEALPELTYQFAGFINGDDLNVLDFLPSITTTAIQSSDVGTYPIELSGGFDSLYRYVFVPGTLTINPITQTITFDEIPDQSIIDTPLQLNPTSTSGLDVSLQVISGPSVVNGTSLDFTDYGQVVVEASQLGNQNYLPAESITRQFNILNFNPTIENQNFGLDENTVNGAVVGTVLASDYESHALSFELTGGNTGTTFALEASSGILSVLDSTLLDYETNPIFSLAVTATDSEGGAATATITIAVNDLTEVPKTPLQPTGLQVVNLQFDQGLIVWNRASYAATYEIQLAADDQFTNILGQGDNVQANEYLFASLAQQTSYYVRVRGFNEVSEPGPYSETLFFATPAEDPFAPVALSGSGIGNYAFTANWQPVDGVQSYILDIALDPDFTIFVSGYQELNVGLVTNYAVTSLEDFTTYYYRVRSNIDGTTLSTYSAIISVTTLLAPPISPVLSDVTNLGLRSFQINWAVVLKASDYVFDVALDLNFVNTLSTYSNVTAASNFAAINGLDPNTTYFYRVKSRNTAGESSYVTGSISTIPDVVAPTITVGATITESTLQAVSVFASGTDNDQIGSVVCYRKPALADAYSPLETIFNNQTREYKSDLAAADYDNIGVSFFFEATDPSGNKGYSDTLTIRTILPSSDPLLTLNGLTTGSSIEDYQIFAFPFTSAPVVSALKDLGPADNTGWRIYRFNGSYQEFPSFTNLEPGVGYWLIVDQGISDIDLGGQLNPVPGSESNPFSVTLRQGWNLIGNPYPYELNWTTLLQENGFTAGEVSSLYTWDRGYQSASKLAPYEGAFIYTNNSNLVLEFPIEAINGARSINGTSGTRSLLADEGGWEMLLQIQSGGLTYGAGGFGVHPAANTGSDQFDIPQLMHFDRYLKLTHLNGNSVDIQVEASLNEWDFLVQSSTSSAVLSQMSFDEMISNQDLEVIIIDQENQNVIYPKSQESYSFILKGTHSFKALSGSHAEIAAYLARRDQFISEVYPNPTTEKVNFTVHYPGSLSSCEVHLELIDLAGRTVERQTLPVLSVTQELTFIPAARPAPGIYFLNIQIQDGLNNLEKKVKLYYK